ncbi:uncharacterized protein SOCE26_059060 [Sorangium cellulosum]|uniref:Glycosyltransferase RgtA/B/C/D-like domain-containing protein n=1 Tax=Sorangium cellulosum TaxID=56 RepID=A0A2L0EYS2_SORCE|nr:hypothetical protein [Sorangium cellulosum]AUX44442.1 uncharacterized protein SOCE26_059060 [Sorangium cellulosum]
MPRPILRPFLPPRRGATLAGIALAVLFVVVFAIRLPEPLGPDQGLFACFGRWVPRGWLPYRDLFDSKPPLFLYWFSLLALVPDELPRALFWLEGAWLAATLAFTCRSASRAWGRAAGVASAALLLAGTWAPGFGGFWARAQAEEILALPMIGSAWLALRALDRERLAFASGLLAGAAGLMKVPALAIAAAWAIVFVAHARGLGALRRVGWLLAGAAVPWAAALAWFGAHGAAGAFTGAVFAHQRAYAALIAPPWSSVLPRLLATLADVAALPLAAAAVGLFALARRRAREATWLAAWTCATFAAIAAQRQLAGYHYLLAAPPLAVAGGYGVAAALRAARRRGRARAGALAALAAVAVLAARSGAAWWDVYAPGAAHLAGRTSRAGYLRAIQPGAFSMVTEEEAARVVREQTRPDQSILVWAFSPGIYALADRHPVTPYAFHKLMLTEAPLSARIPGLEARRAALVRELAIDPPAYVIVGNGDTNAFEPVDSQGTLQRFPELRDLVARDYAVERRIGRLTLHRRKP